VKLLICKIELYNNNLIEIRVNFDKSGNSKVDVELFEKGKREGKRIAKEEIREDFRNYIRKIDINRSALAYSMEAHNKNISGDAEVLILIYKILEDSEVINVKEIQGFNKSELVVSIKGSAFIDIELFDTIGDRILALEYHVSELIIMGKNPLSKEDILEWIIEENEDVILKHFDRKNKKTA
jgi:hypothetical protein